MAQSLDLYWKNCEYDRYICAESEEDNINYLKTIHSCCEDWGARFLEYLGQIDTEYVIVILEDLWVGDEVDSNRVNEVLNLLEKDNSIGVCYLSEKPNSLRYIDYNDDFVEIAQNEIYRISTAPGIWRKDFLISVLKKEDSPWTFERQASDRVDSLIKRVLFLKKPVYTIFHSGGAVSRGRWAGWTKKWANKNGIIVNWEELPFSSYLDTIKFYLRSAIFCVNPHFFTKLVNKNAK